MKLFAPVSAIIALASAGQIYSPPAADAYQSGLGHQQYSQAAYSTQPQAFIIAEAAYQGHQPIQGHQGQQVIQGHQSHQGQHVIQSHQTHQGHQVIPSHQVIQVIQGHHVQNQQYDQGSSQSVHSTKPQTFGAADLAYHGQQAIQGQHAYQGHEIVQAIHGHQANQGREVIQAIHGHQAPQGREVIQAIHGHQAPQGLEVIQAIHGRQAHQGREVIQAIHGHQAHQGHQTHQGRQVIQASHGYQGQEVRPTIQIVKGHRNNQGRHGIQSLQINEDPVAHQGRSEGEKTAKILRYHSETDGHNYQYEYETENGIKVQEAGSTQGKGTRTQGGFSYTGDDGQVYAISYTADENGFRPLGAHLPTPPPIPDEIAKSLEQNAQDEANGVYDDGKYPSGQHQPAAVQEYQQYDNGYQQDVGYHGPAPVVDHSHQ